MTEENDAEKIIQDLQTNNIRYVSCRHEEIPKHVKGQNPKVVVLTCADSRVVPEFVFNKSIGELFVVRVAGNVAIDPSVIISLEYAVSHLNPKLLVILGHTCCGAVNAAEESKDDDNVLLEEIKKGFELDEDHVRGNLLRQLEKLPERSKVISDAIEKDDVKLVGAIYHLENGTVEFL